MTNKSIRDYINLIENAQREEVEEGWTKLPSGDYQNSHTGVRTSKPPVKKKRSEKTGAEWDAIAKAKQNKEQGVAEGFEPGHREIERWATQSDENQKIYNAYIKAGKMADEAYKQKDGATYTGLQVRRKQIRDLIAKKMSEQGVAEEQVEESTPDAIAKIEQLFRK